ncbi:MAG: hypothetical protein K0R90_1676 [Oscillospiraceae bacterium]|jgi:hypothetical protein|nr:hypothetical protein [Oscillospiraceae bacterium]
MRAHANNHIHVKDRVPSIAESITMNYTVSAPCKELKVYGKSVQNRTAQSKNLWDINKNDYGVSFVGYSATNPLADWNNEIIYRPTYSINNNVMTLIGKSSGGIGVIYKKMYLVKNTNYVLSAVNSSAEPFRWIVYNSDKTKLAGYVSDNASLAFNTGNNEFVYVGMCIYWARVAMLSNMQLETGTTSAPYVPFVPNSPSPDYPSTINNASNFDITSNGVVQAHISQMLRSLPNGTQDVLNVTVGQLTQKVEILTLNGAESWGDGGGNMGATRQFQIYNANIKPPASNTIAFNGYCSHFPIYSPDGMWTIDTVGMTFASQGYLRIRHSAADITAFKAWLSANPVTIVYELAMPVVVSVNPQQVNTYYPQTTIATNTILKPNLEVMAKTIGV